MKYFAVQLLTPEICLMGIKQSWANLQYIPVKYRTEEICNIALEESINAFRYVPDQYKTKDLCYKAVSANCDLFRYVPKEKKTEELYRLSLRSVAPCLENNQKLLSYDKPKEQNSNILLKSAVKTVSLPSLAELAITVKEQSQNGINQYTLLPHDEPLYVFDLHLEHQLNIIGKTVDQIEKQIRNMLDETHIQQLFYMHDPLIVGGDVASSISLESLFYKTLRDYWRGPIIGILGNHELWDCKTEDNSKKNIEQIIAEYREVFSQNGCILLHNDLLVCKGINNWSLISEETILRISDEELKGFIEKSYYAILGGLGFSGYDQKYNSELGLYADSITTIADDKKNSDRFHAVYDKVMRCSGKKQIVVVTHMPLHSIGISQLAANCIYLNGHTHQNSIQKHKNGAIILSDNQIGYEPCKWRFKSFSILHQQYNPFEDLPSGIFKVDRRDYLAVNAAYGISLESFKKKGDVILVKNAGVSMFFLMTTNVKGKVKTYILEGARIHETDKDLEYYYNNIPRYTEIVKNAYAPYYESLCKISDEVKSFGGSGRIHGCIVDIDFYNHIYLNPIDGKVSYYYALDMSSRTVMPNMERLLKGSNLLKSYKKQQKKGNLVTLNSSSINQAIVPKEMYGTEMYRPSNSLLKLQYLVEDNIIRVWKDEVLTETRKRISDGTKQGKLRKK